MKRYFILVLLAFLIVGCTEQQQRDINRRDAALEYTRKVAGSKQACFEDGGVEYQLGFSGGRGHAVCVYRK
jgi:hypothetical protein